MYKWVDEAGNVHYSDQPPPKEYEAEEFILLPAPSEGAPDQQPLVSPRQHEQREPSAVRSLPLSELGPLPENESSQYIETISTGIGLDYRKRVAQFVITLKATQRLPRGAYLEVHFPDPANPANPVVMGKVRQGVTPKVTIISPKLKGLKCWNYEAIVYIYRARSRSTLLGTHHQIIQSRINLDKVRDATEFAMAMSNGNCP